MTANFDDEVEGGWTGNAIGPPGVGWAWFGPRAKVGEAGAELAAAGVDRAGVLVEIEAVPPDVHATRPTAANTTGQRMVVER
jgi:hypothetical protein